MFGAMLGAMLGAMFGAMFGAMLGAMLGAMFGAIVDAMFAAISLPPQRCFRSGCGILHAGSRAGGDSAQKAARGLPASAMSARQLRRQPLLRRRCPE